MKSIPRVTTIAIASIFFFFFLAPQEVEAFASSGSRTRSTLPCFSSLKDVESSDTNPETSLVTTPLLTTQQSVQTVAYRASLLGATAVYSFQTVLPILQDAGLSFDSSNDNILETGFTIAAGVLAPKPGGGGVGGKVGKLVDGKVLAAAAVTGITGQPLLGLASLCIREIFYFGVAFKVEAAIGLLASLAVLLVPDVEVSKGVVSLALAVLVFGKFLEPLEEDWQPNQSEFLAKNEMK